MTEDEARTKWCPMARVIADREVGLSPTFNRWEADYFDDQVTTACDDRACRCIASACMMWRTRMVEVAAPGGSSVRLEGEPAFIQEHGYCGLAK